MDLLVVFRSRFTSGHLLIPLCIICLGNVCNFGSCSPSHAQLGTKSEFMSPKTAHMEEYPYEEDYDESKEEPTMFVDACESENEFVKMATGINPDSRLVQLYPSTYVYTTRCRPHRAGKSCRGLDGAVSVCRPKRSWVQVYGRVMEDSNSSWQPHWIAVDTSCACLVKTPLSFMLSSKNKYLK